MFNIAHAGHDHQTEEAVQAATTQAETLNYSALLIITLGISLLLVGIVLAISLRGGKKTSDD